MRRGQDVDAWPRRLRCLNVNFDLRLRPGVTGDEVMNCCGEDMSRDTVAVTRWHGCARLLNTRRGIDHDALQQSLLAI